MRHIILILTLSFFINESFCQKVKKPFKFTKEQYLKKRKTNNIIGYTYLGTGAVLFSTGIILSDREAKKYPNRTLKFDGIVEMFLGVVSGLVSVPFFLVANQYKYKAFKLSMSNENASILRQNNLSSTSQPTISLKISF